MSQEFRSANWYRVSGVRPRLAPQVRVQRQVFRGVAWYVLFDPVNQRTLRLTPQAWHVVARMDGQRTVQALWDDAVLALGSDAPPQQDLIQLLAQLHEADTLLSDALPDLDELLRRRDRQQRERWQRNLLNPLSIRLRLWDPDAFLARTLPMVAWIFGRWGLLLWLAVCVPALLLVGQHWAALSHDSGDRLLSASNLLTMVLVYPLVKGLHELGHAWAAKAGGAEVHDMGLMFLVFAPVPYVDASGSSAFADKRQRALVAAAGMLTELLLAALALYVWLAVEPGVTRAVAFSVMLIGGASTVLFNGNPLLRYDGYFVLCDLIEAPNLAQRSNQFWLWLIKRHAFGLTQAQPPLATRGERVWFALYAPASLAWRISITLGIALFLGREYLYAGLAVGLWGLAVMLLWPLLKGVHYLFSSAELTGRRARPMALSSAVVALLVLGLGAVPAPLTTYAQGVVWPAENAQLRAAEPGFVSQLWVTGGQTVQGGEVAAVLTNDKLDTDHAAAQARELRQRHAWQARFAESAGTNPGAEPRRDAASADSGGAGGNGMGSGTGSGNGGANSGAGPARLAAAVQRAEWGQAQAALAHAEGGLQRLVVSVQRGGRIELPRAQDLPGRWLKKGELMGCVDTGKPPTVRVLVTQDDIALVRAPLQRIEVRLAGRLAQVVPATLLREVPAGDDTLPSNALALEGGGLIAVDPRPGADRAQPHALNRVFQFDLALPAEAAGARIGERAHVRFVHAQEPLAQQAWRRLRQLLLAQLTL